MIGNRCRNIARIDGEKLIFKTDKSQPRSTDPDIGRYLIKYSKIGPASVVSGLPNYKCKPYGGLSRLALYLARTGTPLVEGLRRALLW